MTKSTGTGEEIEGHNWTVAFDSYRRQYLEVILQNSQKPKPISYYFQNLSKYRETGRQQNIELELESKMYPQVHVLKARFAVGWNFR